MFVQFCFCMSIHVLYTNSFNEQQLQALLKDNISRLSKTVTSVLQPYIELFRNADYCLDEIKFQQCEINDPYMLQLIHNLETTINSFLVCFSLFILICYINQTNDRVFLSF